MKNAKVKTHLRRGRNITKRAVVGVDEAGNPVEFSKAVTTQYSSINRAKRESALLSKRAGEIVVEVTK